MNDFCICLVGQNRHIGTRPDVNLQPDFIAPTGTSTAEYVGLVTPPQVCSKYVITHTVKHSNICYLLI